MTGPTGFAMVSPAMAHSQIQLRLRDWWTFSAMLSLFAGLLTNVRFQFVGKASVGELVLAMVALFAVLTNIGNPRFWSRNMALILTALSVSLCGYVISDLVNGTPPDRLIRGWARMAFVMANFIGVWSLARTRVANLFALCVGDSLSTVLSYGSEHRDFLYNYKFHFAVPMTVFIMIVIPFLLRRHASFATGVALLGVGMCHLWLDFRTLGGVCILIGFALIARSMTASRLHSLYLILLMLALILSSVSIGYLYSTTNRSFSERREGSNSQRLSLALAGINAIERSPVVGLGSWTWDGDMWNVYAGRMGRGTLPDTAAGDTLGPHSQIIQAWAEAGLLGLVFFVYFGKLLLQALWRLFFRNALNIMTPLFQLYLLDSTWDLGCSPFANLHRLNIALALVITIQVLRGAGNRQTARMLKRERLSEARA